MHFEVFERHNCQIVSKKLETLVEEQKQRVLRLLLTRVVFEGSRVRIAGVIPVGTRDQHGMIATTTSPQRGRNDDRIADAMSSERGRNEAASFVITDEHTGSRVCGDVEFELIQPILKPDCLERSGSKGPVSMARERVG